KKGHLLLLSRACKADTVVTPIVGRPLARLCFHLPDRCFRILWPNGFKVFTDYADLAIKALFGDVFIDPLPGNILVLFDQLPNRFLVRIQLAFSFGSWPDNYPLRCFSLA